MIKSQGASISTRARTPLVRQQSTRRTIAPVHALPEALLFDCDGVLVDTERDGHRISFNQAFKKMGASRGSAELSPFHSTVFLQADASLLLSSSPKASSTSGTSSCTAIFWRSAAARSA